jgi:hypothetical protein
MTMNELQTMVESVGWKIEGMRRNVGKFHDVWIAPDTCKSTRLGWYAMEKEMKAKVNCIVEATMLQNPYCHVLELGSVWIQDCVNEQLLMKDCRD